MPRRPLRTPDVARLGLAVSFPGIDPRTWASAARVDNDPEALRWDDTCGWIADVGFYGGALDGDSESPCRVWSGGPPGSGFGEYIPLEPNCEVLVVIPEGDPEANPVVVGMLTNESTCAAPKTINELPIDGELRTSSAERVSPFDTEIKRSPYHRREEYAQDRHVQARNQILEAAEQVKLALRDADQSFVRGERFVEVLTAWIDAVSAFVKADGAADAKIYAAVNLLAPGTVTPQEIQAVATAVLEVPVQQTAFKAAAVAGDALSSRIKGD
jgi:hypothetical protein